MVKVPSVGEDVKKVPVHTPIVSTLKNIQQVKDKQFKGLDILNKFDQS